MRKKKVVVLTMNPDAGQSYRANLEEAVGEENLEIQVYTPSTYRNAGNVANADAYLISTGSIDYEDEIIDRIPLGMPVVDTTVAFRKQSIDQIARIPKGTRCLFVNTTEPLALEGIVALNKFSLYNVLLTPMYPGSREYPDIHVAITPGEPQLVPPYVDRVYDLGHRYLTPGTIGKMLAEIDVEYILETEKFRTYSNQFHPFDCNESPLLGKATQMEAGVDLLINAMEGGGIGINEAENIFCINRNAMEILGLEEKKWIGRPYKEALPFLDFEVYSAQREEKKAFEKLVQYGDTSLNVSIHIIWYNKKFRGLFVALQRFNDVEDRQHNARLRLLNRGYTAKYTFDDIIGESQAMVETCRMARKMAKTNSAIVITGESGTGKELLASAIHNASLRASGPYIAINCAAMPENLLESELFGYENGAFTGAKKGGKLGLFECAHGGTLFLDEMEGMSPALQVKLLRVLQEKEVMRLGGTKIIHVDVRIIAATNVDMEAMVRDGAIRKDLYYRLNTMELTLPPLRRRREDIPLLIRHIQTEIGANFVLSQPVMNQIMAHDWDGNVRELKNYVEFFQCLGKKEICLDDLPRRLRSGEAPRPVLVQAAKTQRPEQKKQAEPGDWTEEQRFVLRCLYNSYQEGKLIGRRAICQEARRIQLLLTEQEVRNQLKQLEDMGLVKVGTGRAGSRLTPEGVVLLSGGI